MPYVPMYELLPEVAMKETRTITVFPGNEFGVPSGNYGLIEMYCDEEGCDCRRVIITVISSVTEDSVAVITFGWGSKNFYTKWMYRGGIEKYSELGKIERLAIDNMHGIRLSETSKQSKIAPEIMRLVTDSVLRDTTYIDRLKQHYNMFRTKINKP
jgi:hypothetical protein